MCSDDDDDDDDDEIAGDEVTEAIEGCVESKGDERADLFGVEKPLLVLLLLLLEDSFCTLLEK